ncbi:MAG: BolA/IbaG family iron-sulfur metabolism protein, partial [Pseudomonadales bacterium]|nr:BolA/IbaG family iron-sulfur metabolism protein [Pseudomonadales bacterium]
MSIQDTIIQKLTAAWSPSHLEVINESYKHNVPEGAERHFKVIVAAQAF